MIQEFINKHFFFLFVFTLLFGILLYDLIGFDYTDEFCALLLFVLFGYYLVHTPDWEMNKAFLVTLFIFFFYLCYSFFIGSNSKVAIVSDCIIQIKPYLAFFCVYSLAPVFSRDQKAILSIVARLFWGLLLLIGVSNLVFPGVLRATMGHESYFAAAVVSVSLCYLYASDFRTRDKWMFVLMLSVGILSGRSKFYGFFILATAIVFYFNKLSRIKLNAKNIFLLLLVCSLMAVVAWEKIQIYFIQSLADNSEEKDLIARSVLYITSFAIFRDYFPFGSGFASFATFSSGVYYSDIYVKYGIENVWGISRTFYNYIADTYYPSLAQFGVAGVCLYISFWLYILKKAYRALQVSRNIQLFLLILMIVGYFAIESTSDSTFTTHRGFFIMMLLGLALTNIRRAALEQKALEEKALEETASGETFLTRTPVEDTSAEQTALAATTAMEAAAEGASAKIDSPLRQTTIHPESTEAHEDTPNR